MQQLDLFEAIVASYMDGEARTNEQLYRELVDKGCVTAAEIEQKVPVGEDGVLFSLVKRKVRWWQQSLRRLNIIERVPQERGTWRLADRDKKGLTKAPPNVVMLGFSTDLGVALWGSCQDVFGSLTENIAVCLTSPPYALRKPRAYGNPSESEWVDWMCRALEPIVKRLLPGGSIALVLSNDLFEEGQPSRSLYRERFIIEMSRRFSMSLMDTVIWANNSKAPGPCQWASLKRMQLNTGYEPVLIFCNDPLKSFADNRRVLEPHTESHKRLVASGGEQRARVNSDGAYRVRLGAYATATPGRIPKNVLHMGHSCADQLRMRKQARAAGLPMHGATFPLALAMFLVRYLSRPGDLVVDPFGGTMTTAKACEVLGRLWLSCELMAEYVMSGRYRFEGAH